MIITALLLSFTTATSPVVLNYLAIHGISCTYNSDCSVKSQDGAYCDSDLGFCLLCPSQGCYEAKENALIGNLDDCTGYCEVIDDGDFQEPFNANTGGVQPCSIEAYEADCASSDGAYFCNADLNNEGYCAACGVVDPDTAMALITSNCFDYPGMSTLVARIHCFNVCERDENTKDTAIDADALTDTMTGQFSALEVEGLCFGFGCCQADNEFFGDKQLCEYGSEAIDFTVQNAHFFDYEVTSPCSTRMCGDGSEYMPDVNRCYVMPTTNDIDMTTPCTRRGISLSTKQFVDVAGVCLEGFCVVTQPDLACPVELREEVINLELCETETYATTWENLVGTGVVDVNGDAATFGRQSQEVTCYSTSTMQETGDGSGNVITPTAFFGTYYFDPFWTQDSVEVTYVSEGFDRSTQGRCIIGDPTMPHFSQNRGMDVVDPDCIITTEGFYTFRGMEITWQYEQRSEDEYFSLLMIPLQTKHMFQLAACPSGETCRGTIACSIQEGYPCGGAFNTCTDDTLSPTEEPTATSHGDPIIWTFDDECYDLNKDGMYTASKHPAFESEVLIAVYNEFMREIQVLDEDGEIILSMNNLGEVINRNYPYRFEEIVRDCPPVEEQKNRNECEGTYTEWKFDAQDFRYYVQVLRHDYLDPALSEGELGYHLDIYPMPYDKFHEMKSGYSGLYFDNPFPEESNYCQGGSPRATYGQ